ncbi:MAG: hypothetical protein U0795_09155 [Pirellulales bacterium]
MNTSRYPRRGVSLHELLVTMGILTLLLPTALGWVHRAMTTHRQNQQWAQSQLVLARLAADLRRDFETAKSVTIHSEPSGDGPWLELSVDQLSVDQLSVDQPGSGTVRWVRQESGLVRKVDVDQQKQQQETYQLPDLAQVTAVRSDQLAGLVTLELWMKAPSATHTSPAEPKQEMRIEVVVRSGAIQSAAVDADRATELSVETTAEPDRTNQPLVVKER